ncbi:hypothetical protein PR048_021456 [Dryococelus australis]|uniref:Uncharacterized protein n=1 Tax=Dryococelus australis TaxID=614101 RepID=A0ABQ9GYB0_9NEOP|nr:hypothetical protein PR048_021456 [Dryococelus australis]
MNNNGPNFHGLENVIDVGVPMTKHIGERCPVITERCRGSGADITVISDTISRFIEDNSVGHEKETENSNLVRPCSTPINILGKRKTTLTWRGIQVTQKVYIVKDLNEPILGRPAVEALGMLRWIKEVGHVHESKPREKYPTLSEG